MRIELRDEGRRRIGRLEVDPVQRPTRATVNGRPPHTGRGASAGANGAPSTAPKEVFLNWDTAVDDAGQLRRCVACGCQDMFREKAFPQVTGFVVILAFIGAIVGAVGLATNLPVLITMISVLLLDVAILVFSKRRLVCYRCRSSYHELPIARYHRTWDRATADRYPPPSLPPEAPEEVTAALAAPTELERAQASAPIASPPRGAVVS